MSRRQFYVALTVLAVSGLMGGLLSSRLLPGQAAWAQDPNAQEIRAERFLLVDDTGAMKAALGMGDDGNARLEVYGPDAEMRAGLGLIEGQPGLGLLDATGQTRALLGMPNGEPVLGLLDEQGQMRVGLGMQDGGPMLELSDATGATRALLTMMGQQNDEPTVVLYDAAAIPRVVLGIPEGEPTLGFLDGEGQVIWQAP